MRSTPVPKLTRRTVNAALLRNDHAFKGLDPFLDLFPLTLEEPDIHADAVARAELWQIFAQLRFM
jgi:hypothetical protein